MLNTIEKQLVNVLSSATDKMPTRYSLNGILSDEHALVATTGKILVKLTGALADRTEPGFYYYANGMMGKVDEDHRFPEYQKVMLNGDCPTETYGLKNRTVSLVFSSKAADHGKYFDILHFAKTFKALDKLTSDSVTIRTTEDQAFQMEFKGSNWALQVVIMPYTRIKPDA